eukprot:TRINITY_DN80397_c0_g1_i1.p1 TRINITY_DN80397_c0_g1~~TRINITY_DN80397_c0_g1_i1.p1  ORF type:complete len:272 (+),score=64.40 TRINITY_DN80397_c0_g1_i1:25-840(+)
MSSVGRMDGAFFVSRTELLSWLNSTFQLNVSKVEQCANGAVYCQIIDACHPGAVLMKKVNWAAKDEHQCVPNFKVLQQAFDKVNIARHIEVDKLVRGKYQDNLEMLQWIKTYYDRSEQSADYNALARRWSDNLPEWARPADGSCPPPRPPSRPSATSPDGKVQPRQSVTGRSKVIGGNGYAGRTGSEFALLQEEHERLREEVVDLKITVDGLETERDFYFQKLRDVEILCQAWEERPDPNMTVSKFAAEIQRILYAKDDEEVPAAGNGAMR